MRTSTQLRTLCVVPTYLLSETQTEFESFFSFLAVLAFLSFSHNPIEISSPAAPHPQLSFTSFSISLFERKDLKKNPSSEVNQDWPKGKNFPIAIPKLSYINTSFDAHLGSSKGADIEPVFFFDDNDATKKYAGTMVQLSCTTTTTFPSRIFRPWNECIF